MIYKVKSKGYVREYIKRFYEKVIIFILCSLISVGTVGCSDRNANLDSIYAETTVGTDEVVSQKSATVNIERTSGYDIFTFSNAPQIPQYIIGKAYAVINDNVPYFDNAELTVKSFETYSEFDDLGRCGVAYACIGKDIMPTEERGKIGAVKPTGWHTVRYASVDGGYLYNRCHLIGYQLSGENANEKNLITGTRYLNIEGMLPFEDMTANYVEETNNHVMYRVTPMFDGNNLLASGVLMEGYSVEDSGEGICFCVFCYNVQPNILIDYKDGSSRLQTDETPVTEAPKQTETDNTQNTEKQGTDYILNTNTKKFHYPFCSSVEQMIEKNKREYSGDRKDIVSQGYSPCKRCNP